MASGDNKIRKFKCSQKNPSFLVRRLVQLVEYPISEGAVDRHLLILNEFLNATHYAFWLHDISYIIRLYEHIVKMLDSVPEFKKPLECLLYFSAVPPLLAKHSDRIEYARDLQEYFSVLGYLIPCLHDNGLKILVFNAIHNLLQPKQPIGYCCIPLECCREAVERSKLPEILAQLLQAIGNDLYPLLLNVFFLTCQISTLTCQKMLEENAIEYLLQRYEPNWHERAIKTKPKDPSPNDDIVTFEETCCILWKLLNVFEAEKVNVKNPSASALWSLRYAFKWSIMRRGQRFNRNNLTAIILKLLILFPTMEIMESDLSDDIVILASAAGGCRCHTDIEFQDDEMDFYFKKLIWSCLYFLRYFDESGNERESGFIKSLTKMLFNDNAFKKDCNEQYRDFLKIMLRIIPKILSCSINVFIQIDGPRKIITAVERYLSSEYDIEILDSCMNCLSEMSMMKAPEIVTVLGENNAANVIIGICDRVLENEMLTFIHQKTLARGFCTLQILCAANYVKNQNIINICLTYLNRVIHPSDKESIIDVRTTICAIHLLWECILARKSLFHEFLKKGGIYIMLDVIQACSFPIKSITLGIIADASEKHLSIPYLITWRKCGTKLLPMLMEIFRNKTEKNCDDKQNAQIMNKENYVCEWFSLCQKQKIGFQANCISNPKLLYNCRNKINAIVYALKIKFKQEVEIANEHYKLFNEKLDTNDEITMLFAENFFSLKMCELWINIAKELRMESCKLIDADNEHLNEKITMIKHWKFYLQEKIRTILEKDAQKEYYIELETYATLKDARLSDALDALQDLRFITNCTERMFQMRQKLRLQHEVDLAVTKHSNFHRTLSDLPFTNTFNQTISIQSNVIYEKKEDPCPIIPVSPCDSKTFFEETSSRVSLEEHQMEC